MKVQENTFRTVMGGFHKQEVTDYITALSAEIEAEREDVQSRLAGLEEELVDYKTIVETQYVKIVELTEAGQTLQQELGKAEEELRPVREATRTAEGILAEAKETLEDAKAKAEALTTETEEKEKKALEYARREAVRIINNAREKAQALLDAAKTQAQGIVTAAREKEATTIRRTQARLSAIPSPDERSKKEGAELLANAAKEAQQLRQAAQNEAAQLRQKYETALQELEEQRRQFGALLSAMQSGLDGLVAPANPEEPAKGAQPVKQGQPRPTMSSKERENKAEALRRLFANRNRENYGNAKD